MPRSDEVPDQSRGQCRWAADRSAGEDRQAGGSRDSNERPLLVEMLPYGYWRVHGGRWGLLALLLVGICGPRVLQLVQRVVSLLCNRKSGNVLYVRHSRVSSKSTRKCVMVPPFRLESQAPGGHVANGHIPVESEQVPAG